MTTTGKNRIMIFGPKTDGTHVVEFRTSEGWPTAKPPAIAQQSEPRGSPASPLSREQFANNRRMRCATLPPRLRCCLP
jgi:hypothetical protein